MGAMAASTGTRAPRLSAAMREGERVTPLELFFDLVFVLAITQCTALMSHHPTWSGLVQGLLVLGMLWWAWVGYAWLTSVIDPEEGAVRLVMFGAMAALLIVSLCVPEAFGNLALAFALAYGVFRAAHIALFMLASPEDDALRHSVLGLAASTAVAIALLAAASLFDGLAQGALWALALFLDMAGPYFFGSEGWKLVPGHFAERHGLIVIIALGESIVAIGVGAAASAQLRDRHRRGARGRPWRRRCGGSTSTSSPWSRPGAWPRRRRDASATSWPATPTPTSTCRWSPASCSSPSA